MPSHYAEHEEQQYLHKQLHDLKCEKTELLQKIRENEVRHSEVKDKIDEYDREARSRYYQFQFWEKPSEGETYR